MNLNEAKQELISRYKYLYENSYFILAPFMYEEKKPKHEKILNGKSNSKLLIYLNIKITDNINKLIEEFLFTDKSYEDTYLYKLIEDGRNNQEYLDKVRNGLLLLEKYNQGIKYLKMKLDLMEFLNHISNYLEEQSGDLSNKKNKLRVLDEYYKLLRYRNDGKIYLSGRTLSIYDCDSVSIPLKDNNPTRESNDIGITDNEFITTIATSPYYKKNLSIFTEKEKQQVYLEFHEELPHNLELMCTLEKQNNNINEKRLRRPANTTSCKNDFTVKEEDIFINPNNSYYRYYQICPHCGYMVNIPNKILSEGIKERIETKCAKDDKLFRKMYLYSELFSIENKTLSEGRKLVRNLE